MDKVPWVGTVDPRAAVGRVWVQLSSPMQDSGAGSEVIMFNSASREYRPLFWTEVAVIDHWKNLVKRLVLLLV
jgi:hypothetical protein